jgi:hypothetical protein
MRARALIVCGWGLVILGLFVLSPALWLMLDQMFQQIFGAPLLGIILGGGGIMVPLILTALGTGGIIGGAWMIGNGNRHRRQLAKPRDPVVAATKTPRPAEKTTIIEE